MLNLIEPFTDEWYRERCGKLTSSEMHPIFVSGKSKKDVIGKGGLTYISKKIGEIMTGIVKETPETEIMMRGNALEPENRLRYSQLVNEQVEDSKFVIYNRIVGGTNDGMIYSGGKIKGILECKSPDTQKHIQVLGVNSALELKDIDPQYYVQPQLNMLFAGAEYADFSSYDDRIRHYDLQIRVIRMYPDMEFRKDFEYRIGIVAEIMNDQLEAILKAPERNLAYRLEDNKTLDRLKGVVEGIKALAS